ncbi:MAG: hypothetical protein KKC53_02865 [Actinobacteria bacterium]|nr:hypothetical protein [Actinomycetota bacterium]
MKSKKDTEYLEYRNTFVQPYPRYTIKKIGSKRWQTIKGTLPDTRVKGHLEQEYIIGVLAKWYPGYIVFDIDNVTREEVERIRERLRGDEDNSMLFSSESPNSYHLYIRPTYKGKPPTERLAQDILKPFGQQNNIEIYPQANKTFRLAFGHKQRCLDIGYEDLETWQDYLYFFNKKDDFDISTVPLHQPELDLRIPGTQGKGTYQRGKELYQNGLSCNSSRYQAQFDVAYYLWSGNRVPQTVKGMILMWLKTKHNGYSEKVNTGNWRIIEGEIKRQVDWIFTNYELSYFYPNETHNIHNGYITKKDIDNIVRINPNLPRMRFMYNLIKYCYPRSYKNFINIHSDKLKEWSSTENYLKYLDELNKIGIVKRWDTYKKDKFSKSININWNFKNFNNAILDDNRSPNTFEDTIKLSYRPEEFRELLKEAGSKRTTAIDVVKRIF